MFAQHKIERRRHGGMQKKDLKKLKRSELLEIMLAQGDEIDRLQAELAEKDRLLQNREIAIAESGSIAEASLRLTRIFEEAQKAADLYVENVRAHSKQQGQGKDQEKAQVEEQVSEQPAEPADATEPIPKQSKPVEPKHAGKHSGKRVGKHSGKHSGKRSGSK